MCSRTIISVVNKCTRTLPSKMFPIKEVLLSASSNYHNWHFACFAGQLNTRLKSTEFSTDPINLISNGACSSAMTCLNNVSFLTFLHQDVA